MKIPDKLKSRKLWVTIATFVLVVGAKFLGLDLTTSQQAVLASSGIGYVLAEALVDAAGTFRPPPAGPTA